MIPPGVYDARTCSITIGRGEAMYRFKLLGDTHAGHPELLERILFQDACRGITSRGRRCGRIGCRAHRRQRPRARSINVYAQMAGRIRRIYVTVGFGSDIHVDEPRVYPGVCLECIGRGGDHERGTLCDTCGGSGCNT